LAGVKKSIMRYFLATATLVFSLATNAAESGYIAPITEFGAPDLQGIWSISTQTNLERAQRFGDELVISEEEALRIEAMYQAGMAVSNQPSDPDREAPSAGQNVGGYNTFWMDPGDRLTMVDGEIRTLLLTRQMGNYPTQTWGVPIMKRRWIVAILTMARK